MTPRAISFIVFGTARPKGSVDAFPSAATGKPTVRPVSRGLRMWEAAVRQEAQRLAKSEVFFLGAVRVVIAFTFARPKSVPATKRAAMTVAPDLDKLVRSCFDPLTGVLWQDDAQVTELIARKIYGLTDEPSHARITINDLTPYDAAPSLAPSQEDLYGTPAEEEAR